MEVPTRIILAEAISETAPVNRANSLLKKLSSLTDNSFNDFQRQIIVPIPSNVKVRTNDTNNK